MNFSSCCFSPISTASFYISPWLPLGLSLLASALLLVWLWGFFLSVRSLNSSTGSTTSKSAKQQLKARWALHQLRIIGPQLCWAVVLLTVGWGVHDIWEYHHTFILWDLKVVAEPGDRVENKVVPANTFYFQRASGPVGQIFPRTFCTKYVPGLHDGYRVEVLAATAEHYPIDCWNVAPTPLGIVYNQGE